MRTHGTGGQQVRRTFYMNDHVIDSSLHTASRQLRWDQRNFVEVLGYRRDSVLRGKGWASVLYVRGANPSNDRVTIHYQSI